MTAAIRPVRDQDPNVCPQCGAPLRDPGLNSPGDPPEQLRFDTYAENTWLPHHVIEATTRQGYTYMLYRHLIPFFGATPIADIKPADVRQWITWMQQNGGRPPTIHASRVILSAIFTTALNDEIINSHPCKGVKTPPVAKKPRTIVTPQQFEAIYQALPDDEFRLLVETDIEAGLRWGELTELRVGDLDVETRVLTVSRAVVKVQPAFHPAGGRFLVKEYPKDKEYRRIKLSRYITDKLAAYIAETKLPNEALIFSISTEPITRTYRAPIVDIQELGLCEPTPSGRQYWHGTTTCYAMARCRCEHCRAACARYRAERRAAGKDQPRRPRTVDTDGHIPADWFRANIWSKALEEADLGFHVRTHDLRHAHASWILAGGADLMVVKERLGHASITTTERYLHTLPDADETALRALAKQRGRQPD